MKAKCTQSLQQFFLHKPACLQKIFVDECYTSGYFPRTGWRYLNNVVFLPRNYRLIVFSENLMFLKQIFAREAKLQGQIC